MDLEGMLQESPLWLEDGNLVLTASEIAFKVHRGILERHSEVFRDISSLPQAVTKPRVDGALVIHTSDDPRDLEYFLLALYDGLYFEQHQACNFVVLSGVLRLSIKYTVEHLRIECLKLLHHDWPTTLSGWDLRERETTGFEGTYEAAAARPHPIYVINLAHELGAVGSTLLPAAFYDLSRYNCSHIWTGCASMSQTIEAVAEDARKTYVTLSSGHLHAVMSGKEASQSFIVQFLQQELDQREAALPCEHATYQNGLQCRNAFDDLAHEIYRSIVGVTYGRDSDPLFTLNAAVLLQERAEDGGVGVHPASRACEQCRVEFSQAVKAARRYVWDHIPCWFDLGSVLERCQALSHSGITYRKIGITESQWHL